MKAPDENLLLNEVLSDEKLAAVRRASLDEALKLIARRRRARHALQVVSVLALVAIGIAVFVPRESRRTELAANHPSNNEIKIEPRENLVQTITDEELFALFPGRAVALVGQPGHQELVFFDAPKPN